MNGAEYGKIWDTLYREEPSSISRWRKSAKVYCWWSGAFFDFGFTVKRRSNNYRHWHRCCQSFLRYHSSPVTHTSHRILPNLDDNSREKFVAISDYFLHLYCKPLYWLFHSSHVCLDWFIWRKKSALHLVFLWHLSSRHNSKRIINFFIFWIFIFVFETLFQLYSAVDNNYIFTMVLISVRHIVIPKLWNVIKLINRLLKLYLRIIVYIVKYKEFISN